MWIELGKPVPVGDDVGTTITLTNYIVEAIAASPGGSYPAGSGTTLHITIAGEPLQLTELSAGYESQRVAWTSAYRVELVSHSDKPPRASVLVDEIGREPLAGSTRQARVERGKTVALGDGLALRFTGHGHKMVQAGGPPSPLIVRVEYLSGIQPLEAKSYNLDLPEESTWRWRDRHFRLGEHGYDSFMVLEVGRLPLIPR